MRARARFGGTRESLAAGLATADLRRLIISWGTSAVGSWTFFVAIAVYAYHVGGASAVGVAALVRMVPAGLAAPFAGVLIDRRPRRDVLVAALIAHALLLSGIAVAIAVSAPPALVFALGLLFTVVATAHKPAQGALLPALVETPHQLAACNVLWSGVDNAAFVAGSVIGGALVAVMSLQAAFAATAFLYALAALPAAFIARDAVPSYRADTDAIGVLESSLTGFRAVIRDRDVRLVVGFLSISTLVEGAIDVLVVVVAIQLLDLGGAGVGWLNAAWGFGGLVGGGVALQLLTHGRVTAGLAWGGLMVGVPLMAIAAIAAPVAAGVLLAVLGVGYSLVEVAGLSLLQRLNSDVVLGRALAVVESTYWITTGLGALLAPAVVALLGARGALLAVGACLPLIVAARWPALKRFEADRAVPEREFKTLRAVPVFAPLPMATVENVARRVAKVMAGPGDVVIREGEPGSRFYVVADGLLDVTSRDGSAAGAMASGDCFGEIALLRDIPRTATVTARSDSLLYTLERDAFLLAVGAHPRSLEAAHTLANARVGNGGAGR